MSEGLTKAQKKNLRKRQNKKKQQQDAAGDGNQTKVVEENIPMKEPVTILKEKLADAKTAGDHKLAAKLRQDIWVLLDVNSGIKPSLENAEIDESLKRVVKETAQQTAPADKVMTESTTTSTSLTVHKDIKKINKKLEQIANLKKKQDNGEKLESSQLEKISKEASLREELGETEELINEMNLTR